MHERFNGTMEKWHIEEFHNLCLSLNVIKLMTVIWPVHVSHMMDIREMSNLKLENLVKRNSLRDIGIDGRMLLYIILRGSHEGYFSVADS
jgi:hypothetical protein